LLKKTQYLLDNSQIKSNGDSFAEEYVEADRQSFMTQQQPKQDRNRFFSPMIKEKSFQEPVLEKTDPHAIR